LIARKKLLVPSTALPRLDFSDKNKLQRSILGQKKLVTVISFDQNFDLEKNACRL